MDDGGPGFFDVTLTARDTINSPVDVVHLYINIEAVEEFNPVFDRSSYTVTVSKNSRDLFYPPGLESVKSFMNPRRTCSFLT